MIRSRNDKLVEEVLRQERVRFLCRASPVTTSRATPMSEIVQLLRKESVVIVVEDDAPDADAASGQKGEAAPGSPSGDREKGDALEPNAPRPRPIGIFTERDYLDKLVSLDPDDWLNVKYNPIEQHMTRELQSLSMDEPLDRAIQLMTKRGYRHLPIVDGAGGLFGVISARDIIAYLAEYFPMEIYNLPPTLDQDQVFETREGG